MLPHLRDITQAPPDIDALIAQYAELRVQFSSAANDAAREAVVREWDAVRRHTQNWVSIVEIRYSQDTTDPERQAAQDLYDALDPKLMALDVAFKRMLLESPHRAALEAVFGEVVFARWACDLDCYAPQIDALLTEERQLVSAYAKLIAGLTASFDGRPHSLGQLRNYFNNADGDLRKRAAVAYWSVIHEAGDAVDELFAKLVRVRDQIARSLGYDSFVELGYKRMHRVDYGESDVRQFRAEVLRTVVPLATSLRQVQAERLGLPSPLAWCDRGVYFREGNPTPHGDHTWMMQAAHGMFEGFDGGFAELYRLMVERGLLDLDARKGKVPGGYCNIFYEYGLPFIFANFHKAISDISVFTHEMGHAYQFWSSRDQPLIDSIVGTFETAEIPSMSLEFLSLPHVHHFLGDRAEDFCWIFQARSLRSLQRTMIGDAWQHWVYRNPNATAQERREQWAKTEATYVPDQEWGGLESLARGRGWHSIGHFFFQPFYYIDYALAGAVAMQFYMLDQNDHDEAMRRYKAVCEVGGSLGFTGTVAHAGLKSPFAPGCLDEVAHYMAGTLT